MSRTILAALAIVGLAACGDRNKQDLATTDSLQRDLQMPPTDASAPLNDRPSAGGAPSAARPRSSAAATGRTLAPGATIVATTTAEIRSHKNKVGDEISATVANDVKDPSGRVVIPAGSAVTLKITAIKESENKSDSTGTLTVMPTTVAINGTNYPVSASIDRVTTHLESRKTNVGDVAKVGGGAAAGAVVGRVLGGGGKGAVIGGVIGGAVGAQRAVETKDRDVVLPQGTSVTMTLTEQFVAK